ncbi:cytochrome c3 family protein [Desulfogranum mediterraneum]|uniref:cytochrome c3 family protein n=1 Tax=Desulfogranum mediterraneum TaxID=160661 RepID=UPI0004179757|nr:cytochrome c3 family protein [Desulfogranum mediterraneum]
METKFGIMLIIGLLLCGCRSEEPSRKPVTADHAGEPVQVTVQGCKGCHRTMVSDSNHAMACTVCHQGDDSSSTREQAHSGLVAQPAHPEQMAASCGSCHPSQVAAAVTNPHFTLAREVNAVRFHFGASSPLSSLTQVPQREQIDTPLALSEDLLRKRCLRCHLYAPGDPYPYVGHGTGCAACHLRFENSRLQSHRFSPPGKRQCLSCHYGNYVGSDFYGTFENDYNWEYRTPYANRKPYLRPYGVEQLNLAPDIHQQRGLFCTDCHPSSGHDQPPPQQTALSCASCHAWQAGRPLPALPGLQVIDEQLVVTGTISGKQHQVPRLSDPAHEQYAKQVACQVCHGQWSFNDEVTHLLRSESEDYDPWERLTVQGSYELESLLEHNLYSEEDERAPAMADGISGELSPGIWYKGFGQRRWEAMVVRRDTDGIIKVFRPILDLRLSMVDEDESVLFDNIRGGDDGLRPYTPHTTGAAGLFYRDRFQHLLPDKP